MARTRTEWEAAYAANTTGLSTSEVAEWKLLRDTVITIAILFEAILELFYKDTTNYIDTRDVGLLTWYPIMLKEFQYGDSLIVENGRPKYAVITPANRIITQVAITENTDGTLKIKVAKDSGGDKAPLSAPELTAARNYLKKRRAPGVKVSMNSLAADVAEYHLTALYDPAYDRTATQTALEAAFIAFRNEFDFGGIFYKEQLEAALMAVPGIKSIRLIVKLYLVEGGNIDSLVEYQELPSGYFNWHEDSTITLNSIG